MVVAILAILAACVVLLAPVACTVNRHRVVAEAIKNGADPIAAKCAIEADTLQTPACALFAARRAPQ